MSDDSNKPIPEWDRDEDDQIVLIGLGVLALALVLFAGFGLFGAFFGGGDDGGDETAAVVGPDTTGPIDGATALVSEGETTTAGDTIGALVAGDDRTSRLATLVAGAGLGSLDEAGSFTLFAPADGAFDDIDISALSPAAARSLLDDHLVDGVLAAEDLTEGASFTARSGASIEIGADAVLGEGARVLEADRRAGNGIVHVIDGLLVPAPGGEDEARGAATPTPEPTVEPTPAPTPEPTVEPTPEEGPGTVVDVVGDRFGGFGEAMADAGLAGLLDGSGGDVTVLVPADADLDAALDGLDPGARAAVLTHHVVAGRITAADLVAGTELTSVLGEPITVDAEGRLDGVAVAEADVDAADGVIHLLAGVLTPPSVAAGAGDGDASAGDADAAADADAVAFLEGLNDLIDLRPILFETNSDRLTPEARAILDDVAAALADAPPGIAIRIDGHTDTDGPRADNQQLSEDRARSVRRYLIAEGVDASILWTRGFGERRPVVDPERTPQDKALNRRIELTLR